MKRYNVYVKGNDGVIVCARNLSQGRALAMHQVYIKLKVVHTILTVKDSK